MSGRGIIVDAVTYVETQTTSKTLHCLSNSFNPQDDPPNLEYVVQNQRGRDVVVYVLEQFYSDTDFPNDYGRTCQALHETGKRAERKEGDKTERVAPIEHKGPHSHGAKVVSLLAGRRFGACQCKIIVIRRPKEPKLDGSEEDETPANYTGALNLVRDDFEQRKKKRYHDTSLHGILSISVGFLNEYGRRQALSKVIEAGVVVVSAAGNDGRNFDVKTEKDLPELDPRVIVIGSLDQYGNRSEFSNYGSRVDFWVCGENLDYADLFDESGHRKPGWDRAKGTSFATPIAAGVIACLLWAKQADYAEDPNMKDQPAYARVRAKLNEWAAVDNEGLKHLKNAPGLTLVTPPGALQRPEPSKPRLPYREQIESQRSRLAYLKKKLQTVPNEERGSIRWNIDMIEKELHQLKNLVNQGLVGP